MDYRYSLEKGSRKFHCPECSMKSFVRFVDMKTGEHLPEHIGRCDREVKCGYFLNPYEDGYAKSKWNEEHGEDVAVRVRRPKPIVKMESIPFEVFASTRSGYNENVFVQNLLSNVPFPFELKDVERLISKYQLGTIQQDYMKGAVTFPFIDIDGVVRAVQAKLFDESNHTTRTDFLHSILRRQYERQGKDLPNWLENYMNNQRKVSCLFGEHLLRKYPKQPVGLVEAPKTALYASLYFGFPEFPSDILWLAVYNLSSLNTEKCKALQGRDVYLFPDLSEEGRAFEQWSNKAELIQQELPSTRFTVSDFLERLAPEEDRIKGKDLADYISEMDWRKFRRKDVAEVMTADAKNVKNENENKPFSAAAGGSDVKNEKDEDENKPFSPTQLFITETPSLSTSTFYSLEEKNKEYKRDDWKEEVEKLEVFYSSIEIPKTEVELNKHTRIKDCQLFVESHLSVIKSNNGNPTFLPFLERLKELRERIE